MSAEAKDRKLAEKFFEAIANSSLADMEECLKQGAEVDGALDGVSPLACAVKYDRSGAVEVLANNGAQLDAEDTEGRTALYLAVQDNEVSAMGALVRAGANVDKPGPSGLTPRALAAANMHPGSSLSMRMAEAIEARGRIEICEHIASGDMEALKRALDACDVKNFDRAVAKWDMAPLMLTIRENSAEAMELLLKAGANPNMQASGLETPLGYVIAHRLENPKLAALLLAHGANPNIESGMNDAPLLEAAKKGQEAIVKLLIAAHADVTVTNSSGENAAHKAAEGGYGDLIPLLKEAGTDINLLSRYGQTPITLAIKERHREAFDALLEAGANPAVTAEKGMTTLMTAVWYGEPEVIPELLKRGVALNKKREGDGFTALHFAAFRGKTAAAKALLEAGADYTLTTDDGRTAVQVARERCCDQVAELIIEKMGNEAMEGVRAPQTFKKPLRFIVPGR